MPTDQQIEQHILDKGLTAPRITPADIDANIQDIEIVKHVSKSGQVLRWAVITAKNGFAVTGKPSCAVSADNDNAEIGERVAVDNAKSNMWELMGYELRSKLAVKQPTRKQYTMNDISYWTEEILTSSMRVRFVDGNDVKVSLTANWRALAIDAANIGNFYVPGPHEPPHPSYDPVA